MEDGGSSAPGALVPKPLGGAGCLLRLVLLGSYPLAARTASGASLLLPLGWACSYRRDVCPRVFSILMGLRNIKDLLGLSLCASGS